MPESPELAAEAQAIPATFTPAVAGDAPPLAGMRDLAYLSDVDLTLTVELGRAVMPVREVLKLQPGSVVELDKLVGQPVSLLVNNTLVAKGEVVVVNERFGLRILKFIAVGEKA